MIDNQRQAYVYAMMAVFFWSTVATAFKISLRYLNFVELLLIATLVSTLCFFTILILQGKISLLKSLNRRDLFYSLGLGFLNPFLYYLVVFKAYSLLPAQQAQPLNLVWGIVIVLLSVPILKQKVKPKTLLALLISFSGVVIISSEGNFSHLHIKSPLGVALALGSSLIWSFYWLLNTRDKLDPLVRLFLNCCFGTLFTFLFLVFFYPLRIPEIEGVLGAAYSGVFEMGITFYVWLKALKLSASTARVSILIYFMPFLSLIFIHLFVGEKILLASISGLALIVAGIIIQQYEDLRKKTS